VLNYDQLQPGYFHSGAIVRSGGSFHFLADPLREPASALSTARAPVGSMADKARIAKLWARTRSGSLEALFSRPETTTIQALQNAGFSGGMVEQFFRPFLGGINLERDLITSSRKFEFVFRMFAQGRAALPARGMETIPAQMASRLPSASIRTGVRIEQLEDTAAVASTGERFTADRIVVATEQPAADRLLGRQSAARFNSVTCVYFEAPSSPVQGPWLVLNGEGRGPVNNLCVSSDVCPTYADSGKALVNVSVIGNLPDPEPAVRHQLTEWFGPSVASWKHLRTYRIAYALPLQATVTPGLLPARVSDRLFVCGDYLDVAGQHGAMVAGRKAAEALIG
jgi:hypothetical protein